MVKTIVWCAMVMVSMNLKAQSGNAASGGNATGSGGSSSYSVGQTLYTSETGSSGEVSKGVQQPYEILVITGIDKKYISIETTVYPNPTTGSVMLKLSTEFPGISYTLSDATGKIIRQRIVNGKQSMITMEDLAEGIYYIKVTKENSELKTFKIIKNN